ncbi:hypothetical protein DFO61_0630 [Ectopseudomonas oleovorans]|uniref:Uncharacterized protein n=1 Tax=Ectopseudomonas oleovorans TaxID=301 RepID=A0A397NIM0_ECTOL|nr:hypothetical protein [Pseudomonas oleovorans]RIA36168.1 hypothetical protein DFO61_0630 [Pseudomonas oleovorans]
MSDPFKPPAAITPQPTSTTLTLNILLIILAAATTYLLVGDIQHLLATQKGSLTRAGSVSFFHHIYLVIIPQEAAYFRLASSMATLALILFLARNHYALPRINLFLYAYGISQLTYQILAVTGVIGILNQISQTSVLNLEYWLSPSAATTVKPLLIKLAALLITPIAFLVFSLILVSKAKKLDKTIH